MGTIKRGGWVLGLAWLSMMGAVSFAGCGPSASSICDRICECVGCSDSERDDCIDEFEDAEKDSQNEGCPSEWDDLVACIDEELECDDEQIEIDGCDSEVEELAECADGEVTFGAVVSPCNQVRGQCGACGEAQELCLSAVDLLEEQGGAQACQGVLDAGGVQCAGAGQ